MKKALFYLVFTVLLTIVVILLALNWLVWMSVLTSEVMEPPYLREFEIGEPEPCRAISEDLDFYYKVQLKICYEESKKYQDGINN